jgi:hypothetical protein
VKSELRGDHDTINPASVDAKLKTDTGLAGTSGGGLDRCFPPTPKATMKVITTGIQATFSYLDHSRTMFNQLARKYRTTYQLRTLYPQKVSWGSC